MIALTNDEALALARLAALAPPRTASDIALIASLAALAHEAGRQVGGIPTDRGEPRNLSTPYLQRPGLRDLNRTAPK